MKNRVTSKVFKISAALFMSSWLLGCSNVYYDTLEGLGIHKRDLLVDEVEDAREAQEEGKKQFTSSIEQFKSVVNVPPSNLEDAYDKINTAYNSSKTAANKIHKRIDDVEKVSADLFTEWKSELEEYTSDNLRTESQRNLKKTQEQYNRLITTMKKSEDQLTPVLNLMYDQVLYLKHNLNAQAIGALKQDVHAVDKDVARLLDSMQKSIDEADSFIDSMKNRQK